MQSAIAFMFVAGFIGFFAGAIVATTDADKVFNRAFEESTNMTRQAAKDMHSECEIVLPRNQRCVGVLTYEPEKN